MQCKNGVHDLNRQSNARKTLIARNFSLAATTYDMYSTQQTRHGTFLIEALLKIIPLFKASALNMTSASHVTAKTEPTTKTISNCEESNASPSMKTSYGLDIGCGTGYLTKRLSEALTQRGLINELLGIDIATSMIDYARKYHRNDDETIEYRVGDIEDLGDYPLKLPAWWQSLAAKTSGGYDLIFSNAALHWVNDLPNVIKKLKQILSKTGVLALALYLDGTYQELDRAQRIVCSPSLDNESDLNDDRLIIKLPRSDEVKNTLIQAGFKIFYEQRLTDALKFDNFRAFHRYQHYTGTRNDQLRKVFRTKTDLLTFIKTLENSSSDPFKQFQLTMNVGFFIAGHQV